MIQQLLQTADLTSILLIAALIAAFVIAFKVMEMIFDTVLIAGISGAFYLGLRTIQGGPVSINDLLLFTFLGSSIYMLYSLLHSIYQVGTTILPIPYRITKTTLKPISYVLKKTKKLLERDKADYAPKQSNADKKKKRKEEEKNKEEKTTKEVILGSKDQEDEDEE